MMSHPSPTRRQRPRYNAAITGTGSYVPENVVTNADLSQRIDTSDKWIRARTGIQERRLAAPDQATSDLGAHAAARALEQAGVAPGEVDLIIAATLTPDMPFPNTGCFIQSALGASNAACMGLEAACSGFLFGLQTGAQYIATGAARTVLVIGAEKMSSILDWEDRTTCVLFGDGAGAAVLQPRADGRGWLGASMGSDGHLAHLLRMPAGGSRQPASTATVQDRLHYLKMEGREVYRHAVKNMVRAADDALRHCDLTADQLDWIIPHQANQRIIHAIADRLRLPLDRFCINLDRYGNTSAASIAIALDEAARDGRLQDGQRILMLAFGGGFTWAAGILEWTR